MDECYVEALKAIADPNRLRLFWLLVQTVRECHASDRELYCKHSAV